MSQERVYQMLSAAAGEFLSGQQLSTELGITRASVWKAVEALRRQGCDIEARSGCGYRLRGMSDRLGVREITAFLSQPREALHVCDSIDSTNTQCKRLAAEGAADGTVVISEQQTAGRGRKGRSFQSPQGLGLYLSVLWRPQCAPTQLLPLTSLAAVAVSRAIERVTGEAAAIKWPNDLLLRDRKIAGILTEMSLEGESGQIDYVVLGIGINVHQTDADFTPDVAAMASSLDAVLGRKVSRPQLAAALMEELDILRNEILWHPERYWEAYCKRCLTIGRTVQLIRGDGRCTAQAIGVDEQFGLIVHHEDGTQETVRSGEVSVRGLYGYV